MKWLKVTLNNLSDCLLLLIALLAIVVASTGL